MTVLTKTIRNRLLANGRKQVDALESGAETEIHFRPVVKLFTPDANCTWLLTEIDPDAPEIAFGLSDLGLGFPELGTVSLSDLAALRGYLGLPVEIDRHFKATKPISRYAADARRAGRIVT